MKKFLKTFDGLWALPLAFIAFIVTGYLLQTIGGLGTGSYDLAFFQPLFLSVTIVIGASTASVWGLWFTFRDLHKQIYHEMGRKDFYNLREKTKAIIALTVFFLYFFAIIFIYLKLV
ncbi:MAG: hypothetical protein ACEQSR_03790 [Candidatus Methylacidiphilales bacterium]